MPKRIAVLFGSSLGILSAPAVAQTSGQAILYELPAYLGRSVTISKAMPDLDAVSFANRAQSAKFVGEWEVCPEADYEGACVTMTGNKKFFVGSQIASLRTTSDARKAQATASSAATTGAATTSAAVDLEALDVDAGSEGQDVAFFSRPALNGTQVSAGSNDTTSGTAFCKLAGYTSAAYAGRARVQAAGLIDVATKTKLRAFPLRDVLCRK